MTEWRNVGEHSVEFRRVGRILCWTGTRQGKTNYLLIFLHEFNAALDMKTWSILLPSDALGHYACYDWCLSNYLCNSSHTFRRPKWESEKARESVSIIFLCHNNNEHDTAERAGLDRAVRAAGRQSDDVTRNSIWGARHSWREITNLIFKFMQLWSV
jgi:hypothetical protein